jgi:hypothetical protein
MNQMTIQITSLNQSKFPMSGKANQWKYNHAKVRRTSGTRVYLVAYRDNTPLVEFAKQMSFENGTIYIKNGKNKIEIGTYQIN